VLYVTRDVVNDLCNVHKCYSAAHVVRSAAY